MKNVFKFVKIRSFLKGLHSAKYFTKDLLQKSLRFMFGNLESLNYSQVDWFCCCLFSALIAPLLDKRIFRIKGTKLFPVFIAVLSKMHLL